MVKFPAGLCRRAGNLQNKHIITALIPFYNRSTTHAASHTQSGQAGFYIAFLHFMEKRNQDAAAGASYGMSQGNGTAVYVQFIKVEAQIMSHGHRLGGKSFISFY